MYGALEAQHVHDFLRDTAQVTAYPTLLVAALIDFIIVLLLEGCLLLAGSCFVHVLIGSVLLSLARFPTTRSLRAWQAVLLGKCRDEPH